MARLTNKQKIIQYLSECGLDIDRENVIVTNRYQKRGTVVVDLYFLSKDERLRLTHINYSKRPDGKYSYDDHCPIQKNGIRDHFHWVDGLLRLSWKEQ